MTFNQARALVGCALALIACALILPAPAMAAPAGLPQRLSATGLYVAGSTQQIAAGVRAYTPQYALWSDGADKQRWLRLPPGRRIDASAPDAWSFPPGTRLWKEFAHGGRRIETRMIERLPDGRWRYASYVWQDDGSDAVLAPEAGAARLGVEQAPGGRYDVPPRADCLACHEGAAVPVLGFSALQLSAELPALVAGRVLTGLPAALIANPPRIAARSPTERAALGLLHANCGHCHNDSGSPAPVQLLLAQRAADPATTRQRTLDSTLGVPARWRPAAAAAAVPRIAPGRPEASALLLRMRSRHAASQMPPLGTQVPDAEGLALVERWIANELFPAHKPEPESQP